jgi:ketosteroid isomerase-like protein
MLKMFIRLVLIALAGMSIEATAQTNDTRSIDEAVEKLRKLMIDPDQKGLDAILHDKLNYGHSSGRVEDKRSLMESLASGASDFVSIDLTEQVVTVEGSTATVRHSLSAETNDKGKGPSAVKLSVFTVWVKHKNEWKLLGRQAVKI